jgi:hypothetical protein
MVGNTIYPSGWPTNWAARWCRSSREAERRAEIAEERAKAAEAENKLMKQLLTGRDQGAGMTELASLLFAAFVAAGAVVVVALWIQGSQDLEGGSL